MHYGDYLAKLKTLSKKVPSLEDRLSKFQEELIPIDERVFDMQREIRTANDSLTNVELRVSSISDTSSKLEHDLPIQKKRFDEMEYKLNEMGINISDQSKNITSFEDQLNADKEQITMAEKNQTSHVRDTPTDFETKVKLSQDDIFQLKQDMSNTGEIIKNRLTKLAEDLETSNGKFLKRTSQLDTDISKTEVKIGSMIVKVDEYSGKLGQFKSNVNSLSADVNKMKPIVDYAGLKVQELDINVRNLQSQNTGMFLSHLYQVITFDVFFCS